jgi:hypothetical protein
MKVSGQLHALAALLQGESLATSWIGGWVVPRAVLDDKFPIPMRNINLSIYRYTRTPMSVAHHV